MLITQQNYIKTLQSAEYLLDQALRYFQQQSKTKSAVTVLKIRNELRGFINERIKEDKRAKFEEQKKK